MDELVSFLTRGVVVGVFLGLPALLITTLCQRLLKGCFYGWRYFVIAAGVVMLLSGNVAFLSIEASSHGPEPSGVAAFAGVILFPFGISVLVTEIIYVFAWRYYKNRAKPTIGTWNSSVSERYWLRAKRKIRIPRSHYWVQIYDERGNLILQSKRLQRRVRDYAEVVEDGFALYDQIDDVYPSLRLGFPSVHEGYESRVDVIDCRRNERVGSLDKCDSFLLGHWCDWKPLDYMGKAIGNFRYSSPMHLYHCDLHIGDQIVGQIQERFGWFRFPLEIEIASEELDRSVAFCFAALVVALRERQDTAGPAGGG